MPFRTVRYFCVLSVIAIISFACDSPETAAVDWCRVDGTTVPAIISSNATTIVQLEEMWRVGNSSDDQVLAGAFAPATDPSGRIAIPDPMLQQVILIGPDGEWRGPILTGGEGPGEVMVPVASQWLRDGSLITLDALGPKTVRYDVKNNELLADVRGAQDVYVLLSRYGEIEWIGISGVGEILMEAPRDRVGADPTTRLSAKLNWYDAHNTDAKPVVLMDIQTTAVSAKQIRISPGFLRPLAAIGPGNVIALAGDTDKYRVRLLNSNRADSVLICRDVPAFPLTESERGVREVDGLEEFIELRVGRKLLEFFNELLGILSFPSGIETPGPFLKGLLWPEIAIDMHAQ